MNEHKKNKDSNSRREFIKKSGFVVSSIMMPTNPFLLKSNNMTETKIFDVIIIGGSYSGLAAAMAIGRALRTVLIIDSGNPCNKQTPYSHNFITHDGRKPAEIAQMALKQVLSYSTVSFFEGLATEGSRVMEGFEIRTDSGDKFKAKKLVFATGIRDVMPKIKGFSECWGISILHCPYCHGYEVKNTPTGIFGKGDNGFEFSNFIYNWSKDITLFTNGEANLSNEQILALKDKGIKIDEREIQRFEHVKGYLEQIVFKDGSTGDTINAIYAHVPFEQHCKIPETLGCVLNEDGYLEIDQLQKTTMEGIYACGDNTTRMRTVANAVAMGTKAGMMLSKELILEEA